MEISLENLYVDKDRWKRVCNWRRLRTGMTFDGRENSKWVSVKATKTGAVHIMIESLKRALTGLTQATVKLNHSTTVWIMTELSAVAMAVKPIFAAVILPAELAQLVQQWPAEWEACRLQGGGGEGVGKTSAPRGVPFLGFKYMKG